MSALKINVELKVCVTSLGTMQQPLLLSPTSFGAAKHFHTKNADGELSYKYKDIQSKFVDNLDKLTLFQQHLEAFDMLEPFLIPVLIDLYKLISNIGNFEVTYIALS